MKPVVAVTCPLLIVATANFNVNLGACPLTVFASNACLNVVIPLSITPSWWCPSLVLHPTPCSSKNLHNTLLLTNVLLLFPVSFRGAPVYHTVDVNNTLATSPAVRFAINTPSTNFEKKQMMYNHRNVFPVASLDSFISTLTSCHGFVTLYTFNILVLFVYLPFTGLYKSQCLHLYFSMFLVKPCHGIYFCPMIFIIDDCSKWLLMAPSCAPLNTSALYSSSTHTLFLFTMLISVFPFDQ
eukprot:TRINITY_DN3470_c0_g4_i1.p1 TRINITY_DN3470_c0_g4~~TRINITY_DN3470_c0_g4_i1.p1  ORF type:complete len:240 (+),score=18.09 TRINITY_DN3470_c0_g4_i1:470-1189(+)